MSNFVDKKHAHVYRIQTRPTFANDNNNMANFCKNKEDEEAGRKRKRLLFLFFFVEEKKEEIFILEAVTR